MPQTNTYPAACPECDEPTPTTVQYWYHIDQETSEKRDRAYNPATDWDIWYNEHRKICKKQLTSCMICSEEPVVFIYGIQTVRVSMCADCLKWIRAERKASRH